MRSLRELLAEIVDYAGLFPPAALTMEQAVGNYEEYLHSPEAWMLGRFVVPASRLEELEGAAKDLWSRGEGPPWALSVLAGDDPAAAAGAITAFQQRHAGGRARVSAIEAKAVSAPEVRQSLDTLPDGIPVFFELPVGGNLAELVVALAEAGGLAKIRTGGITEQAFPAVGEVAGFIAACARSSVPFKATAGLHHPIRGEYRLTYEPESACGKMFGFFNVFLSAAFLFAGELGEASLPDLLLEPDPGAITFSDAGVSWRNHHLGAAQLGESRRRFALSYGSCSFAEPVQDLKGLSLL